MRLNSRNNDETRQISFETNVSPYAEGSCLVKFGNTHVLCTASIDDTLPTFLKGKGSGWVTAEYSMLPRATHNRNRREAALGKQSGRTQEIQRLISRSLRAVTDLEGLGERQIIVDCDVLQADGGTRTASITGGYVALHLACKRLIRSRIIHKMPMIGHVAAISCGILYGNTLVDVDYNEDSSAEVDANFVLASTGKLIEVQCTAEKAPFTKDQFDEMYKLAAKATEKIFVMQAEALGIKDFF